jgi:hypothetical protein
MAHIFRHDFRRRFIKAEFPETSDAELDDAPLGIAV